MKYLLIILFLFLQLDSFAGEVELHTSGDVAATTEVADTLVPANGVDFSVYSFIGSLQDTDSIVKLVWKYGSGSDELLWSSANSPAPSPSFKRTGDGVSKIAVVTDNKKATAQIMSGFAKVWLED